MFLHYAFDKWMERNHPDKPFTKYADDAVAHCRSRESAEELRDSLSKRLEECGIELHPIKTRIIYCKDYDIRGNYPDTLFGFLEYTFQPRRSKNKYGKYFINFTPAVRNKAKKAMRQKIHDWRMHLKPDIALEDLSRMFNPVLRGEVNYYGCFYKSEMYSVLKHMNMGLVRWVRRKYKKLKHQRRARYWFGGIARRERKLFVQWQFEILSFWALRWEGARMAITFEPM